jgi:ABC-type Fe3+ transport system substrate-binding protein
MKKLALASALLLFATLFSSCSRQGLTLYTEANTPDVQKIADVFTRRTGIPVNVVHFGDPRDLVEAIASYSDGAYVPAKHSAAFHDADIVFSEDIATGEALKTRGALAQYAPDAGASIPEGAKSEGWWYGVGGRAWVLAWNTDLAGGGAPKRLPDLASDAWPKGSAALPNPNYMLYYTAGMSAAMGGTVMADFLNAMIAKDAQWMASPAETAALVAEGRAWVCLTTLKEAAARKKAGAHIAWALPDQGEGEPGAYVQYNVVCLCRDSAMPDEAKRLYEFLLSPEAEAMSVERGLGDVTLRPCGLDAPVAVPLKTNLAEAQKAMQEIGNTLIWFTPINTEYKGK